MSPTRFWRDPFVADPRPRRPRSAPNSEYYVARRDAMIALYRDGSTLESIAQLYGVTRERARQVIAGAATRGKGLDPIRAVSVCRRAQCLSMASGELGVKPSDLKNCLLQLGYWRAMKRLWNWRRAKAQTRYTDAQLITALQNLAAKLGHTPGMPECNADPDMPSHTTYVIRWGNWVPACVAAGLPPNRRGARGGVRKPRQHRIPALLNPSTVAARMEIAS